MRPNAHSSDIYRSIVVGSVYIVVPIQVIFVSIVNYIIILKYPRFKLQFRKILVIKEKLEFLNCIKARLSNKINEEISSQEIFDQAVKLLDLKKDIAQLVGKIYFIRHNFKLIKFAKKTKWKVGSEKKTNIPILNLLGSGGVIDSNQIKRIDNCRNNDSVDAKIEQLDEFPDGIKLVNEASKTSFVKGNILIKNESIHKELKNESINFFPDRFFLEGFDNASQSLIGMHEPNEEMDISDFKQNLSKFATNSKHFENLNIDKARKRSQIPTRNLLLDNQRLNDFSKSQNFNLNKINQNKEERSLAKLFQKNYKVQELAQYCIDHTIKSIQTGFEIDIRNQAYLLIKKHIRSAFDTSQCHVRTYNYGMVLIDTCLDYFGDPLQIAKIHQMIYNSPFNSIRRQLYKFKWVRGLFRASIFIDEYLEYEVLTLIESSIDVILENFELDFEIYSNRQQEFIKMELSKAREDISSLIKNSETVKSKDIFKLCQNILLEGIYSQISWHNKSQTRGLLTEEKLLKCIKKIENKEKRIMRYFSLNKTVGCLPLIKDKEFHESDKACELIANFPFLLDLNPQFLLHLIQNSEFNRVEKNSKIEIFHQNPNLLYLFQKGVMIINESQGPPRRTSSDSTKILFEEVFAVNLGVEFTASTDEFDCSFISVDIESMFNIICQSEIILDDFIRSILRLSLLFPDRVGVELTGEVLRLLADCLKTKSLDDLIEIRKIERIADFPQTFFENRQFQVTVGLMENFKRAVIREESTGFLPTSQQLLSLRLFGRMVIIKFIFHFC
jgi:hypothetical protein